MPETDTELDEHTFTRAAPAAVLAARRDGGDDPHGIVLGELLASELLNRAQRAGLGEVQLVAVAAGRSWSQLSFSAGLHDRPLLEVTLRASGDLARRVIVSRSEDQDVVVRLEGQQRHVLLGARLDEDSPVLLCLGLHMDGRACLAGWEALGHVVIATQPGTGDAQKHAAALVATLVGQRSPEQLRLYTLAGPSTPIGDLRRLPHQRARVDSADPGAATAVLTGLRAEVEARQRGDWSSLPEVIVVVGELATVATRTDTATRLARTEAVDPPVRVAQLVTQVPLVVDCERASIWCREGRLQLERGGLLELLMYVAASPLLDQGSAGRWPGVSADTILDDVWSPRARDARNRESGQTWLRKTLSRVQSEVGRLAGGSNGEFIIDCDGNLRLNPTVAVSDVEAFLRAVERARITRGSDQLQAAEEAVVVRPPALLPDVSREGSAQGCKFQIYGWLDQPDWERAARRLDAFGLFCERRATR